MTAPRRLTALIAATAACLVTGPATAQDSASSAVTIGGEAENVCSIPTAPFQQSAVRASLSGTTITLDPFTNTTNALLLGGSIEIRFSNVMCNFAAKLGIITQNGAMTGTGLPSIQAGSGAFISAVDYNAQAVWGGVSTGLLFTASNPPGGKKEIQVPGANLGVLRLVLLFQSYTTPILAGTYTDVLTVKVGPTI